MQVLKDVFLSIGNFIDEKLKTTSGRITLIIATCLVLGASVMHSINITDHYNEVVQDRNKFKKEADSLQTEFNKNIRNAENDCNERIRNGAILQQELRFIFNSKTAENLNYIKEHKQLIEEQEKVNSIQENNIKTLEKSLNN